MPLDSIIEFSRSRLGGLGSSPLIAAGLAEGTLLYIFCSNSSVFLGPEELNYHSNVGSAH